MRDIGEFEQKCMDIIEVIVSIDKKNTREDAIRIAKKMRDKLIAKTNDSLSIYECVVKEFELATDEEFDSLKKQIFK